jgi:hypothetical protein
VAHLLATTAAGTFALCPHHPSGMHLNVEAVARRIACRWSCRSGSSCLLQMILFLPRMMSIIPDLAAVARALVAGRCRRCGSGTLRRWEADHRSGRERWRRCPCRHRPCGVRCDCAVRADPRPLDTTGAREPDASGSQWHWIVAAIATVTRVLCPSPVGRAAFEFTVRTLARSRSHRLLMATYVGVALAFVGSAIIPLVLRRGLAGFAEPASSCSQHP